MTATTGNDHTPDISLSPVPDSNAGPSVIANPAQRATSEAQQGRPTVIHVINGEHFSGAERVQDLLALGLPDCGYDIQFACLKPKSFPEFRQSDVDVHDLKMHSKLDMRVIGRLEELADNSRADIIHAHTPRSAMIGSRAAKRTSLPFVYHVHSPTSRDSTRRVANWMNQRVEKRAMNSARALITVSKSLKSHVVSQGIPESLVHVVTNGVAPRPYRPRQAPTSDWVLGTVALFRPRKGTEVMLEALAKLRQDQQPVKLLAVGGFESPDYESFLKSEAERLGIEAHVEWTGFCQNVDSQWDKMDAMVLPSLFGEGLPMVVLEAMASGVPVIASAVEGVPEAIRDGIDGLLCDPGDADHLAECVRALVSGKHDWLEIRKRAHQRQTDQFSTQSMARGVADVYDRILARANS